MATNRQNPRSRDPRLAHTYFHARALTHIHTRAHIQTRTHTDTHARMHTYQAVLDTYKHIKQCLKPCWYHRRKEGGTGRREGSLKVYLYKINAQTNFTLGNPRIHNIYSVILVYTHQRYWLRALSSYFHYMVYDRRVIINDNTRWQWRSSFSN